MNRAGLRVGKVISDCLKREFVQMCDSATDNLYAPALRHCSKADRVERHTSPQSSLEGTLLGGICPLVQVILRKTLYQTLSPSLPLATGTSLGGAILRHDSPGEDRLEGHSREDVHQLVQRSPERKPKRKNGELFPSRFLSIACLPAALACSPCVHLYTLTAFSAVLP